MKTCQNAALVFLQSLDTVVKSASICGFCAVIKLNAMYFGGVTRVGQ